MKQLEWLVLSFAFCSFLICFALGQSAPPYIKDSYSLHSIASLSQWKKLLHYRGKISLIRQDSGFFLSPLGAINPQSRAYFNASGIWH